MSFVSLWAAARQRGFTVRLCSEHDTKKPAEIMPSEPPAKLRAEVTAGGKVFSGRWAEAGAQLERECVELIAQLRTTKLLP